MPTKVYSLEEGQPQELVLDWNYGWENLNIYLDGAHVGAVREQASLISGQEFTLPDGARLKVQLVRAPLLPRLSVLHNSRPLPGSPTDPAVTIRISSEIILLIAAFNLLLGGLAVFTRAAFLGAQGLGAHNLLLGLAFLGLGLWTRRRSGIALWSAIVLLLLEGMINVAVTVIAGGLPGFAGLLLRLLLLVYISQGAEALREIRLAKEKRLPPKPRCPLASKPPDFNRVNLAAPNRTNSSGWGPQSFLPLHPIAVGVRPYPGRGRAGKHLLEARHEGRVLVQFVHSDRVHPHIDREKLQRLRRAGRRHAQVDIVRQAARDARLVDHLPHQLVVARAPNLD
jgi:hypothetical protein